MYDIKGFMERWFDLKLSWKVELAEVMVLNSDLYVDLNVHAKYKNA